jgi:hypothetical protein
MPLPAPVTNTVLSSNRLIDAPLAFRVAGYPQPAPAYLLDGCEDLPGEGHAMHLGGPLVDGRRPSQSMPIAISTAWLAITPASRTRS